MRDQYSDSDGGISLTVAPGDATTAASAASTERLLELLAVTPTGVVAMSPSIPGAVETSTSLNVVDTEGRNRHAGIHDA